jgi:hypothetical protein
VRFYNRYILTAAVLLLLTTVILVALKVGSLEIYYTVYVMETLAVTELYSYFNAQARRGLHVVSIVLFLGFGLIVLARVARIIL